MKKGTRVIAIRNAKYGRLFIYGAGVYVGEEIPTKKEIGFDLGAPNPKIELDNGRVVFGCECWWGAEEAIRKKYKDYQFVEVSKK